MAILNCIDCNAPVQTSLAEATNMVCKDCLDDIEITVKGITDKYYKRKILG